MYFRKSITLVQFSNVSLSNIFWILLCWGPKNFFLSSLYKRQFVKICFIVTWRLQMIQIGGSSAPGKYLSRAKPVVSERKLGNRCLEAFTPCDVFVKSVPSCMWLELVYMDGKCLSVVCDRATGHSFHRISSKFSHNLYFNIISNYFFYFFKKNFFSKKNN